jgi:hypothetical protein
MDIAEVTEHGLFASADEAVAACKEIVDTIWFRCGGPARPQPSFAGFVCPLVPSRSLYHWTRTILT